MSLHHPRLPLGAIWLAIPSLLVYAVARCASTFITDRRLRQHSQGKAVPEAAKVRWLMMRSVKAILCSGSYVLAEISVASERLRVKVMLL